MQFTNLGVHAINDVAQFTNLVSKVANLALEFMDVTTLFVLFTLTMLHLLALFKLRSLSALEPFDVLTLRHLATFGVLALFKLRSLSAFETFDVLTLLHLATFGVLPLFKLRSLSAFETFDVLTLLTLRQLATFGALPLLVPLAELSRLGFALLANLVDLSIHRMLDQLVYMSSQCLTDFPLRSLIAFHSSLSQTMHQHPDSFFKLSDGVAIPPIPTLSRLPDTAFQHRPQLACLVFQFTCLTVSHLLRQFAIHMVHSLLDTRELSFQVRDLPVLPDDRAKWEEGENSAEQRGGGSEGQKRAFHGRSVG